MWIAQTVTIVGLLLMVMGVLYLWGVVPSP